MIATASHDQEEVCWARIDLKLIEETRRNRRSCATGVLMPTRQSRNAFWIRGTMCLPGQRAQVIMPDTSPTKTPRQLGYRMPAESEPHEATWLASAAQS